MVYSILILAENEKGMEPSAGFLRDKTRVKNKRVLADYSHKENGYQLAIIK
jgi:hypothetical protein